jgi:hypothetical protein
LGSAASVSYVLVNEGWDGGDRETMWHIKGRNSKRPLKIISPSQALLIPLQFLKLILPYMSSFSLSLS